MTTTGDLALLVNNSLAMVWGQAQSQGVSLYSFGFWFKLRGELILQNLNIWSRMTFIPVWQSTLSFHQKLLISCKLGVGTTKTVQRMTFGKPGTCQNPNFSFSLTMCKFFLLLRAPTTWICNEERNCHNLTTISLYTGTVPVTQGLLMCIVWKV